MKHLTYVFLAGLIFLVVACGVATEDADGTLTTVPSDTPEKLSQEYEVGDDVSDDIDKSVTDTTEKDHQEFDDCDDIEDDYDDYDDIEDDYDEFDDCDDIEDDYGDYDDYDDIEGDYDDIDEDYEDYEDESTIVQNGTSEEKLAHHSRYPIWGKYCTGSGPVNFANSPMRIEDINFIAPYGDVVGGHITPIDHMYFEPKDRSLGRDVYEVRAMQDALIFDISVRNISAETNEAQESDWRLDMAHTCTFTSYFDLLTSVTPEIEEAMARTRNQQGQGVFVEAGQLIGYVGGQTLDFGVYDYEVQLPGLINPNAYVDREPWKIHTVDPFQYFPTEVADLLLAKLIRAVEPRAGKIDYDVMGTLSGNWFELDTDWYNGINQMKYWEGHLSIAPHQIDPTVWRAGIGFLDTEDNNFVIVGEESPLEIDAKSGPVTYELKRSMVYIPADPDKQWWFEPFVEGEIYGVKIYPETVGTIMLHLEEEGLLKLEVFLDKKPSDVDVFTENAKFYQR